MSLDDLVKKKGGQKLDPAATSAKMSILKQIADLAGSSMGDDIKGLKKVTVASNDPAGLAEGLDKAKDMVQQDGMPEDGDDAAEEGASTDEEGKADEKILEDEINHETGEGDMSDEEIDELIALLQSKKHKL